ncbi:MAG: flagellar biosynthesis protein, partial [Limnobacter sp.]|nr:flagellar biosynthesis protein [Limnobacter sp.]
MKIKRYVGRTTREAMAKLRAELGADAIVLKNQ